MPKLDYYPTVDEPCWISNCGKPYEWCTPKYMGKSLIIVEHSGGREQHYHLQSVTFMPVDKPAKAVKDLAKMLFEASPVLFDHGEATEYAQKLHSQGVRLTRHITSTVIDELWSRSTGVPSMRVEDFAKRVVTYVLNEATSSE